MKRITAPAVVKSVVKPMARFSEVSLDEIEVYDRLIIPLYPARAGWSFDREEILRALDYLHITAPIKLRYQSGRQTVGVHGIRLIDGVWGHRITVNQNFDVTKANNTLWHELVHASQAARMVRETGKPLKSWHHDKESGYPSRKGPHGETYRKNQWEIEARAIALQMETTWLLLK